MSDDDQRAAAEQWPETFVPVPFELDDSALVVVDMQRDWTDPAGPVARSLANRHHQAHVYVYVRLRTVVDRLVLALDFYRRRDLPVVHVTTGAARSDARDLPPHLRRRVAGHTGALEGFGLLRVGGEWHEIADPLMPRPGEPVLNKTSRCAFNPTSLDPLLRNLGVTHLLVGGLITNGCVDPTARDGADLARVFGSVVTVADVLADAREEMVDGVRH